MWVLGLILFHLVFWKRLYMNPFHFFTGEAAAHEFPSSRLLGECLREGKPIKDPYFYHAYTANPINASYYPPHRLQAWIGSYLSLDRAWVVYQGTLMAHYLGSSLVAYYLFGGGLVGFFGAITLTYMAYNIKQNASIIYTVSWMPVILLGGELKSCYLLALGWGMALLGGYWPLALYMGGFGCLFWVFS